ncbi:tyrosine recombinase XerS [Texcoconibacillus texcoconensis]|uniref:Site-specific recombinase XerD n=1 Tax=Texcoconibacillus texcoconensis TaxID=1095777 RepID=A0A840QQS8_9BACI|nr:tyrosine recombinase XerS [Texcoconibacillus texcoconensis]MBB5173710.1 site-specific recombinase XerD [Texcoconibacillus texcoconensis]
MSKEMRQKIQKRIKQQSEKLPWYAREFIDKRRRKLSQATLLNYCHDYFIFFDWIVEEGIYEGERHEVPLDVLEKLTRQEIEDFLSFLDFELDNSERTVNRKLSALKSLFHYLQNIAETRDLEPYLYRNVMAKIELNPIKEDQETVANRIETNILRGDEYEQFRHFVAYEYGILNQSNKKALRFYEKNCVRDVAIISLILGSGMRLSEVVGLNVTDIDFKKNTARVVRKGKKEQYVYFSEQAMTHLQDYLAIRDTNYPVNRSEKALFISYPIGPKGTASRLTPRSVEKMIEKYATAFGKPGLSVHKLRHSFATKYQLENNDIPKLRRQLGHSSVQTTMVYTHLTNQELQEAVSNMDRLKEN